MNDARQQIVNTACNFARELRDGGRSWMASPAGWASFLPVAGLFHNDDRRRLRRGHSVFASGSLRPFIFCDSFFVILRQESP